MPRAEFAGQITHLLGVQHRKRRVARFSPNGRGIDLTITLGNHALANRRSTTVCL